MVEQCPGCGRIVYSWTGCPNCFPSLSHPRRIISDYRNYTPRFSEPDDRVESWLNGLETGYDQFGRSRFPDGRGGGGSRGCRYPPLN